MSSPERLKIDKASPEQAEAIRSMLTRQRAEKLAAECLDLTDDAAVIRILTDAFESAAAAELFKAAWELAKTQ
ncbi:hypothetical protein [Microvirga makkahensis]|uniref:Uncharacterized protein n=1 Tax=Microvirga makkahensis TaxID=1128670 RepID=A0A7X3MWK4_9HYPH|nr:hypothetical protein [Microvirga makkahensis]MXQ14603.1 hypothetical protein [Microvirga makkahensis]